MECNPLVMREAFVRPCSILDATIVEHLLEISATSWSEANSNRWREEKRTQTHWRDLLQDLEGLKT